MHDASSPRRGARQATLFRACGSSGPGFADSMGRVFDERGVRNPEVQAQLLGCLEDFCTGAPVNTLHCRVFEEVGKFAEDREIFPLIESYLAELSQRLPRQLHRIRIANSYGFADSDGGIFDALGHPLSSTSLASHPGEVQMFDAVVGKFTEDLEVPILVERERQRSIDSAYAEQQAMYERQRLHGASSASIAKAVQDGVPEVRERVLKLVGRREQVRVLVQRFLAGDTRVRWDLTPGYVSLDEGETTLCGPWEWLSEDPADFAVALDPLLAELHRRGRHSGTPLSVRALCSAAHLADAPHACESGGGTAAPGRSCCPGFTPGPREARGDA
jgi:hypothetical protein